MHDRDLCIIKVSISPALMKALFISRRAHGSIALQSTDSLLVQTMSHYAQLAMACDGKRIRNNMGSSSNSIHIIPSTPGVMLNSSVSFVGFQLGGAPINHDQGYPSGGPVSRHRSENPDRTWWTSDTPETRVIRRSQFHQLTGHRGQILAT